MGLANFMVVEDDIGGQDTLRYNNNNHYGITCTVSKIFRQLQGDVRTVVSCPG